LCKFVEFGSGSASIMVDSHGGKNCYYYKKKQCPNQHKNKLINVGYFYKLRCLDLDNNQHKYVVFIL